MELNEHPLVSGCALPVGDSILDISLCSEYEPRSLALPEIVIKPKRRKKIKTESHPKLGMFDVIYADPPWKYAEVPYFKKSLAVQYQYPPLTTADLMSLNVNSIAKENSWLFLWAVWAQLPQALDVIKAWGFEYKTAAFVWTKRTVNGKKAKTYGRACGAQSSVEIVLLAKKGAPAHFIENEEQEFESIREGHSKKPDIVYDKIDRIVTPPGGQMRKIELFARQQHKDWYALGNDESLNQQQNPLCLYGDIREIIGVKLDQSS
jgi:N6-adenosine-specific RNA methylase IME4